MIIVMLFTCEDYICFVHPSTKGFKKKKENIEVEKPCSKI